jgi:hypothetical protein
VSEKQRKICWFSCGAASAVATRIALQDKAPNEEILIYYCDTGSEHPDSIRFLKDCEKWFGRSIHILKSDNYEDVWEVWEKEKWLIGPKGARCTIEMKKKMRYSVEHIDDIQVWGYDISESERAERFKIQNPDMHISLPLIDNKVTKEECFAVLRNAGIELPAMYRMGYKNNNCIGCVKGGMGYWNKIRKDFPEVFNRMAILERKLDIAILHEKPKGIRKRVFLDELEPSRGNYKAEPSMSCGFLCGADVIHEGGPE